MASIKYVDFKLTGDPAAAKTAAAKALEGVGFELSWTNEWTATAKKGNRVANLLLGSFALYVEMGLSVMSVGDGVAVVRLEKITSGMAGGLIGMSKTTRMLKGVSAACEQSFSRAGVLIGLEEG